MISIPYVKGVSETLARAYRCHGVSVAMKPHLTLKCMLVNLKNKRTPHDTAGVVYQIPSKDYTKVYTGERAEDSVSERRSIIRMWTQSGKRSSLGQEERSQWRNTTPQLSQTAWPIPIIPLIGRGSNVLCLNPSGISEGSSADPQDWAPHDEPGRGPTPAT